MLVHVFYTYETDDKNKAEDCKHNITVCSNSKPILIFNNFKGTESINKFKVIWLMYLKPVVS